MAAQALDPLLTEQESDAGDAPADHGPDRGRHHHPAKADAPDDQRTEPEPDPTATDAFRPLAIARPELGDSLAWIVVSARGLPRGCCEVVDGLVSTVLAGRGAV
jgi:hypothetical protein